MEVCCNYFHQDACVMDCPSQLVPGANMECGEYLIACSLKSPSKYFWICTHYDCGGVTNECTQSYDCLHVYDIDYIVVFESQYQLKGIYNMNIYYEL